ncbi:hypothetical protein ACFX11_043629 [Malus domestica]
MAPRKRKTTEQEEKQLVAQDSGQRVTRSMARPAPSGSSAEPRAVAPARKKAKGAQKKKEPAKKEEVEVEEAEAEAVKEEEDNSGESKAEADAENENKKKKGKEKVEAEAENKEEKGKAKVEDDGEGTEADDDESDKRTIVIEHCKQCKSFKVRADQVKNGLEKGVPGIKVLLNPDKPRKGCLEIREEGGETFLSLLDMKRPFSKMKALNMEEVINDIVEKIK